MHSEPLFINSLFQVANKVYSYFMVLRELYEWNCLFSTTNVWLKNSHINTNLIAIQQLLKLMLNKFNKKSIILCKISDFKSDKIVNPVHMDTSRVFYLTRNSMWELPMLKVTNWLILLPLKYSESFVTRTTINQIRK